MYPEIFLLFPVKQDSGLLCIFGFPGAWVSVQGSMATDNGVYWVLAY